MPHLPFLDLEIPLRNEWIEPTTLQIHLLLLQSLFASMGKRSVKILVVQEGHTAANHIKNSALPSDNTILSIYR